MDGLTAVMDGLIAVTALSIWKDGPDVMTSAGPKP
jgi:hypothetical protein